MANEKHLENEIMYVSNQANFSNFNEHLVHDSVHSGVEEDKTRDAHFRIDLNKF